MNLNNTKFIISCPNSTQWINDNKKEIVILGKSNVGKSTFINMITNNKNLAKTSSTPGHTRLLNFFDVDNLWRIVDAPGYGYSAVSKTMDFDFSKMMEEYFDTRKNLVGAILLIDSRRGSSEDDKLMLDFITNHNIPFIIVATKCDKLNQSERSKLSNKILDNLRLNHDTKIINSSNTKRDWIDIVVQRIEYILK